MTTRCAVGLAVLAVLIFIIIRTLGESNSHSGFYTGYASEEPTRDYIPYTGTIPYGTWGVKPWAYADES